MVTKLRLYEFMEDILLEFLRDARLMQTGHKTSKKGNKLPKDGFSEWFYISREIVEFSFYFFKRLIIEHHGNGISKDMQIKIKRQDA